MSMVAPCSIADTQGKTGQPLSVLDVATDKVRLCGVPAADAHVIAEGLPVIKYAVSLLDRSVATS